MQQLTATPPAAFRVRVLAPTHCERALRRLVACAVARHCTTIVVNCVHPSAILALGASLVGSDWRNTPLIDDLCALLVGGTPPHCGGAWTRRCLHSLSRRPLFVVVDGRRVTASDRRFVPPALTPLVTVVLVYTGVWRALSSHSARAPALPCTGPCVAWSGRLVRLDNAVKMLNTANAFISTLGGGHFLCKHVGAALALAAAQMRVARLLGDDRLLARCRVHTVYAFVQVGRFRTAMRILRGLEATALGADGDRRVRRLQVSVVGDGGGYGGSLSLRGVRAAVIAASARDGSADDPGLLSMCIAARHYCRRTHELWQVGTLLPSASPTSRGAAAVDEYFRQRLVALR